MEDSWELSVGRPTYLVFFLPFAFTYVTTLSLFLSLLSAFCFSCTDVYGFFFWLVFFPSFVLRMLGMIAAAGDYLHTLFEFIRFSFCKIQ